MSAFIWGTVCVAWMKIEATRDHYPKMGHFDPPRLLNWPKSPHQLGLNISFFMLFYLWYYHVPICERFGNWSDVIYGFMQYVLKHPYIDKWEEFMYKSHTVLLVLMVLWWKIATQVKCKWIWRFAFLTLSPDSCIRFLRLGWTIFRCKMF